MPIPAAPVNGAPVPYRFSAVGALSRAWALVKERPGPIYGVTFEALACCGLVIAIVIGVLWSAITSQFNGSGSLGGLFFELVLAQFAVFVFSELMGCAVNKAALVMIDGRVPTFTESFEGWSKTSAMLVGVVPGVGIMLATIIDVLVLQFADNGILILIAAVVMAFLIQFAIWGVLDDRLRPGDAFRRSIAMAKANVAEVFLLDLLVFGVFAVIYFIVLAVAESHLILSLFLLAGLSTAVLPVLVLTQAVAYRTLKQSTPL